MISCWNASACCRTIQRCSPNSRTGSGSFWWMNIRTPTSPSTCGSACWRRSAETGRRTSAAWDDDQSIYGWRGAEVDNILRFEKDFPCNRHPARTELPLDRAHLGAAAHLIARNEDRLGKTLFTDGDPARRSRSPAHGTARKRPARRRGDRALQQKGQSLNEVAILVRASFQMREFEERFITLGLPYR